MYVILQETLAQQQVLGNNQSGVNNIATAPSANSDWVNNNKNSNQNRDSIGNTEPSTTKTNKSKPDRLTGGLQQFLKLQQSILTPQQSLNADSRQPKINQHLQQPELNQNLPINLQQQFQRLPLNLQNQILQKQDKQISPKKQPSPVAIQNTVKGKDPLSSLRVTGISLAPLNNGQTTNLPVKVTQGGVNFSNLGLPPNIPYFLPTSGGCVVNTQSNNGPISNVPVSVVESTQYHPINVPIPISTSLSTDSTHLTNAIELTSSTAYESPINQVLLAQSQPYEVVQMVQPVEYQIPSNQLVLKSDLDTTKIPQTVEYQTPSNQIQVVEPQTIQMQSRPYVPNQQVPIPFVTNQNQYSNTLPNNYPAPFVMQSNQGSKSSSMKTLLPLLVDLIKQRNWGCHCPKNYNRGCKKNNVNHSDNNSDTQIPPPELIEGYTNRRKNEQQAQEKPMSNSFMQEEPSPVYIPEKTKFRNYKNSNNYSAEEEEEEDDYDYDYEDESDYED